MSGTLKANCETYTNLTVKSLFERAYIVPSSPLQNISIPACPVFCYNQSTSEPDLTVSKKLSMPELDKTAGLPQGVDPPFQSRSIVVQCTKELENVNYIYATLLIASTVVTGELLCKYSRLKAEYNRKFIHITAGVATAAMPLLLNFGQIVILASFFTPLIALSYWKKLLCVHTGVKRKTYGEILFPAGVVLTAFLFPQLGLYLFGILIMVLADGLAGIVGSEFSRRKYTVLGQTKSFLGSATFFVVSLTIGLVLMIILNIPASSLLPLVAIVSLLTLGEAVLHYGLDNLLIPVAAAGLFQLAVLA